MMKDNPTTVYIYPESHDIDAVARAGRGGSYWNASCLKEIGAPKFWPKEILEPILARYEKDHPPPPPRTPPICKSLEPGQKAERGFRTNLHSLDRLPPGVAGLIAELLLDPDQLVVFRQTIRA